MAAAAAAAANTEAAWDLASCRTAVSSALAVMEEGAGEDASPTSSPSLPRRWAKSKKPPGSARRAARAAAKKAEEGGADLRGEAGGSEPAP